MVEALTNYIKAQLEEVARHKWFLSENAGEDIGWYAAIKSFINKGYAADFHKRYCEKCALPTLESETDRVLNGDSCLIVEFKVIAHNHETGEERVLEDDIIRYCFGRKETCSNRREISQGLYQCLRKAS